MQKLLFILSYLLYCSHSYANDGLIDKNKQANCVFIENKGQVCNQDFKPRADVLFSGSDGQLNFHLKNNGISYQLNKIDSWQIVDSAFSKTKVLPQKIAKQITTYRVDVNWLNANIAAIKKGHVSENYDNYYLQHCPDGILNVNNYSDVTYQNIYDGIDLKWYQKDGHLKYDYIVAAGANYRHIKLQVNGAKKISINKNGELVISTVLGDIVEQAPEVIQNKKTLQAKWKINGNIVSYEIENVNPNQSFIIDPIIRTWGTYYGDNNMLDVAGCTTDTLGNVFITGSTNSYLGTIIATAGSYQSTANAPYEAYLVKFNDVGVRQWGTYYGGDAGDLGRACVVDKNNNIYMVGGTSSTTGSGIASIGSYQYNIGGISDAFIVKFNSLGFRIWGTYYGGLEIDNGLSCSIDTTGNVYLCGMTESINGTSIASTGSHQSTSAGSFDAFLVKFNSNGVRLWGTYYGGLKYEVGWSCSTDLNSNVYLAGYTSSNVGTAIATIGSHQDTFGNPSGIFNDAFLVKFNSNGIRQWGTYYGGDENDLGQSCAIDSNGDVYLIGTTTSSLNISTSSAYQINYAGSPTNFGDAFIVKFNSNGIRQWGTYYGDSNEDYGFYCTTDISNNVYVSGYTKSSSGNIFATPSSHQSAYGGGTQDAFLVKFDAIGNRQWGTYYGGTGKDNGNACTVFKNIIYLVGYTESSGGSSISTSSSHQPNFVGVSNMYVAQFRDCNSSIPPVNSTANPNICANNSASLSVIGFGTIDWYNSPSGGTSLGSGTSFITPTLSVGTYTFYAEDNICNIIPSRTAVTVTVMPSPIAIITGNDTICNGEQSLLTVSGSTNVVWSNGLTSNTIAINPNVTSNYWVVISNSTCTDTAYETITVLPNPTAVILGSDSICNGETEILTASAGTSYLWSTGVNTNTISVTPLSSSNYSVIVFNSTCSDTAFLVLNVFNTPVALISGNDSICNGQSTLLTVSGSTNVVWSNNLTTNTINVNPTSTSNYSVIASNAICSDTTNIIITVFANPTATISGNDSICSGQNTTLIASGGNNYSWSSGANTNSISVSPIATNSYSVLVSNANCVDTAMINVQVFQVPVASISGVDSICLAQSAILTAGGIGNYTWSNFGTNFSNIIVTPTINTTYTLIVSNSVCSDTAQKIITVNPLPIASIMGTNSLCSGQTATLIANGGVVYNWNTGNVNASISVSPINTTNYSVMVTNIFGCQSTAYTTVTVVPMPMANISGDTVICASELLSLSVSGVGDFLWNTGETTSNITSNPTINTNYVVTASNACGNVKDSIFIIVNPLPIGNTSNDTTILIDNSVSLFAFGGDSYLWLPANLSCNTCSVVNVSPNTTTVYTVTISSIEGCSITKEIKVIVESEFEIFIPDIFSPNGDGQNDILFVRGIGVKELSFKMYDRLGEKIFETTDITKGWDGTYKGSLLNNAVFVYELSATLANGSKINKHGDVTLIR